MHSQTTAPPTVPTVRLRVEMLRWATENRLMLVPTGGHVTSLCLQLRRSLTVRQCAALRALLAIVDPAGDYSNVPLHKWGPVPLVCRVAPVDPVPGPTPGRAEPARPASIAHQPLPRSLRRRGPRSPVTANTRAWGEPLDALLARTRR